jgi:hypothetical protein
MEHAQEAVLTSNGVNIVNNSGDGYSGGRGGGPVGGPTTTPSPAAPTADDNDDSSVLPLDEQTMRPPDLAVYQQRVVAWHPILDPNWMIYSYLILAAVLIPIGESILLFGLSSIFLGERWV